MKKLSFGVVWCHEILTSMVQITREILLLSNVRLLLTLRTRTSQKGVCKKLINIKKLLMKPSLESKKIIYFDVMLRDGLGVERRGSNGRFLASSASQQWLASQSR